MSLKMNLLVLNQIRKCTGISYHAKTNLMKFTCAQTTVYSNIRNFSCITSNRTLNKYNYETNDQYKLSRKSHHTESGIFKFLSESKPVEITQNFLVTIHDTTGLPWWGSIIFTTVMLRSLITLPLAVYQSYIMAKLQNIQLEMPAIAKELKMETVYAMKKFNWTEKQAKLMFNHSLKKQWTKLIVRDNCHPLKSTLLLWIQIPMWVFISIAIRNLTSMLPKSDITAQIIYSQFSVGGFLWIPNLIDIDHSFILPVALGIFNLAVTEIHVMLRSDKQSRLQRYITNFIRFVSICMIPIAAYVPSALCLYWTTSSVFGFCQNLLLISPKVKRFCKIPPTNSEISKPYEHLLVQIGQRFSAFKKN